MLTFFRWSFGILGISTLLYNGWVISTWPERPSFAIAVAIVTTLVWGYQFIENWAYVRK